jgi:hypothetical protein
MFFFKKLALSQLSLESLASLGNNRTAAVASDRTVVASDRVAVAGDKSSGVYAECLAVFSKAVGVFPELFR